MPRYAKRGKYAKRYPRYKRKYRRTRAYAYRKKSKARSKPRVKTIQSSTYVAKSKIIRFEEVREYTVHDDHFTSDPNQAAPVYPCLSIPANNPVLAWQTTRHTVPGGQTASHTDQETVSGDWKPAAYFEQPVAMPNVTEWISDSLGNAIIEGVVIDGDDTTAFYTPSRYRHAEVLSSNITVTALPQVSSAQSGGSAQVQDSTILLVQKTTDRFQHFIGRNKTIDAANNGNLLSKMPYTVIGHTHTNIMGNPKGATCKMGYSFKAMNQGKGREAANFFTLNSEPMEHDSFHVALVPRDPDTYMSAANRRLPPHVVTIKLCYYVKLSEPRPLTRDEALTLTANDLANTIGQNTESMHGGD